MWIEDSSGVMRIIRQELWKKVEAKHGHYLIILDRSKSKEYTAIIKFIKPKTPIVLSRGAVTKKFQVAGYMQLVGGELCKPGSSSGSIFFLFALRVARAHTHGSQGKSPATRF